MLISMPTGTSTIFGVFQAISDLLSTRTADCRTDTTIRPSPNQRKRASADAWTAGREIDRVNIAFERTRPDL